MGVAKESTVIVKKPKSLQNLTVVYSYPHFEKRVRLGFYGPVAMVLRPVFKESRVLYTLCHGWCKS